MVMAVQEQPSASGFESRHLHSYGDDRRTCALGQGFESPQVHLRT